MNKQVYSIGCAFLIVIVHVFLTGYLWFVFIGPTSGAEAEITSPLAAVYFVGIVKWIVDTQGHITSVARVGMAYIGIVSIIVVSFLGALVAGPVLYDRLYITDGESLNKYYAVINAGLGAAFAIVYRDLYGNDAVPPTQTA